MGGMLMTFTNIFYISRTTKNKIASSRFFPHIQSDHLLEYSIGSTAVVNQDAIQIDADVNTQTCNAQSCANTALIVKT